MFLKNDKKLNKVFLMDLTETPFLRKFSKQKVIGKHVN